jgi:hypothetical protein
MTHQGRVGPMGCCDFASFTITQGQRLTCNESTHDNNLTAWSVSYPAVAIGRGGEFRRTLNHFSEGEL